MKPAPISKPLGDGHTRLTMREELSGPLLPVIGRTIPDMRSMFEGATAFNQPLGKWKVGPYVNVERMFQGASAFKQDLSAWATKPKLP